MEYLLRERVTTISPNLSGFSFGRSSAHRAAYLFVLSARLCTATSRRQLIAGFPQPGIEKIFHVLPRFRRDKIGRWEKRFLYNNDNRELASVTGHAVKRWRFAPFANLPSISR